MRRLEEEKQRRKEDRQQKMKDKEAGGGGGGGGGGNGRKPRRGKRQEAEPGARQIKRKRVHLLLVVMSPSQQLENHQAPPVAAGNRLINCLK